MIMSKRDKQLLAYIGERQAEVARLLKLPPQAISQGIKRAKDYFQESTLEQLRVALLENNKADKADLLAAFCLDEAQRRPTPSLKESDTKRRISNNLYENFVVDDRSLFGIWALVGDEAIARIPAETKVLAEVLKRPTMKNRTLFVMGSNTHLALLENKLADLIVSQWLTTLLIASDNWEQQLRDDCLQSTGGRLVFMEQEWPPFTLEFLVLRRKVTAAGIVFTKKGFVPLESSIAERYMTLLDPLLKLAAVGQSEDSKRIDIYWHSDMLPYLRCLALWESFLKTNGLGAECSDVLHLIRSCFEDYNFYVNRRIDWVKASAYLGFMVAPCPSGIYSYWSELDTLHAAVRKAAVQPNKNTLEQWEPIDSEMLAIRVLLF